MPSTSGLFGVCCVAYFELIIILFVVVSTFAVCQVQLSIPGAMRVPGSERDFSSAATQMPTCSCNGDLAVLHFSAFSDVGSLYLHSYLAVSGRTHFFDSLVFVQSPSLKT